jgi:fatty-acyl-CoA synthase
MEWVTTVSALVKARAEDDRPGLLFEGRSWTWREHTAEAAARAAWYETVRPQNEPPHIGVLLENVPEYSFWLAAAALGRFVLVGLNATRKGDGLLQDVAATDCHLVLTDRPELFDGVGIPVLDPHEIAYAPADLPAGEAETDDLYLLIFTSGTTGSPKAVMCSQGKIATQGLGLTWRVDLKPEDTSYLSMPLFHSNAVIAGWSPSLAVGATMALKRRFSASSFIDDCRAVGATFANYVGTPLSYVLAQPERPDDADNPLVRVFGNEGAPADLERFASRFGCQVLDGFGSTEGGISITKTDDTPPGSLGRSSAGDVRILDSETGEEKAAAEFDPQGRLANAEQAVGELVNMDGPFAFEGYWNAPDDTAHRNRDGRYWSGDLGYRDADGFLYFAGRSLDRLRVGGENFPAAPVARLLTRHPAVVEAVVYAVPDATAGDQLMAAVVPGDGFDPTGFAQWVAAQPDASRTWVPRYLRVGEVPKTATGKVLVRQLSQQRWDADGVWIRDDSGAMRPLTEDDRAALEKAFADSGRPLL